MGGTRAIVGWGVRGILEFVGEFLGRIEEDWGEGG